MRSWDWFLSKLRNSLTRLKGENVRFVTWPYLIDLGQPFSLLSDDYFVREWFIR
jgi:hypothetical protein